MNVLVYVPESFSVYPETIQRRQKSSLDINFNAEGAEERKETQRKDHKLYANVNIVVTIHIPRTL